MSKFYRDRKGFFGSFFRNSGWYLILAATALVVVGIFSLLFAPKKAQTQVEAPQNEPTVTQTPQITSATDAGHPVSSENKDVEVVAPAEPEPAKDVVMILPVQGTVGTGFSATVPVFSETMKDWRVHQGVDYLTENEVDVVAAADGVVESVYRSELMGMTVEIRHEDGAIAVYQSLAENVDVVAGQTVKQGDRIGKTGKTADCETAVGNHLHFAVLRNGVFQNPDDCFGS